VKTLPPPVHFATLAAVLFGMSKAAWAEEKSESLEIGSRRELFVDSYLIDQL
jgi:hypothetical protein